MATLYLAEPLSRESGNDGNPADTKPVVDRLERILALIDAILQSDRSLYLEARSWLLNSISALDPPARVRLACWEPLLAEALRRPHPAPAGPGGRGSESEVAGGGVWSGRSGGRDEERGRHGRRHRSRGRGDSGSRSRSSSRDRSRELNRERERSRGRERSRERSRDRGREEARGGGQREGHEAAAQAQRAGMQGRGGGKEGGGGQDGRELLMQLLLLASELWPDKVAAILLDQPHIFIDFFSAPGREGSRRILLWFSHFSMEGSRAFRFGAAALANYALVHREEMWDLLRWEGKHPQAPVSVAAKPHYFCELAVGRSVRALLAAHPAFWRSEQWRACCADGAVLELDRRHFCRVLLDQLLEPPAASKGQLDTRSDAAASGAAATRSRLSSLLRELLAASPWPLLCQRLLHQLHEDTQLLHLLNTHAAHTALPGVGKLLELQQQPAQRGGGSGDGKREAGGGEKCVLRVGLQGLCGEGWGDLSGLVLCGGVQWGSVRQAVVALAMAAARGQLQRLLAEEAAAEAAAGADAGHRGGVAAAGAEADGVGGGEHGGVRVGGMVRELQQLCWELHGGGEAAAGGGRPGAGAGAGAGAAGGGAGCRAAGCEHEAHAALLRPGGPLRPLLGPRSCQPRLLLLAEAWSLREALRTAGQQQENGGGEAQSEAQAQGHQGQAEEHVPLVGRGPAGTAPTGGGAATAEGPGPAQGLGAGVRQPLEVALSELSGLGPGFRFERVGGGQEGGLGRGGGGPAVEGIVDPGATGIRGGAGQLGGHGGPQAVAAGGAGAAGVASGAAGGGSAAGPVGKDYALLGSSDEEGDHRGRWREGKKRRRKSKGKGKHRRCRSRSRSRSRSRRGGKRRRRGSSRRKRRNTSSSSSENSSSSDSGGDVGGLLPLTDSRSRRQAVRDGHDDSDSDSGYGNARGASPDSDADEDPLQAMRSHRVGKQGRGLDRAARGGRGSPVGGGGSAVAGVAQGRGPARTGGVQGLLWSVSLEWGGGEHAGMAGGQRDAGGTGSSGRQGAEAASGGSAGAVVLVGGVDEVSELLVGCAAKAWLARLLRAEGVDGPGKE